MKQIYSLIRQDMTNSIRDNIVVYIIIAPLLIALAVRAFFPSFEAAGLNFAVESGIDTEIVNALERYGRVEIYKDAERVISRVERADAVPGIIGGENGITLIFEGNEPEEIILSYTNVLEKVTSTGTVMSMDYRLVGTQQSHLYEYIIIVLVMMIIFMGAVVSGFNIIHDKETRALQALSVSPVRILDFLAARGAVAVGLGIIIVVLATLILMGAGINYLLLIAALIVSSLLTTLLSLILGTFADNQITAIAVLKLIMPFYLALPLVSIFVREDLEVLFYILPNYWQFKMLEYVYIGGEAFNQAALLTFIVSGFFFAALVPILKKKLKLR